MRTYGDAKKSLQPEPEKKSFSCMMNRLGKIKNGCLFFFFKVKICFCLFAEVNEVEMSLRIFRICRQIMVLCTYTISCIFYAFNAIPEYTPLLISNKKKYNLNSKYTYGQNNIYLFVR